MKKIIVEYLVSSQKTAILEDDKLIELLIEDNKNSKKVSNIYRGVVKKVIPGIQACFVDIGFEKLAYLQLGKDSNIKAGQDILVQVNKEEVGTKGAKLNTEISLAGRYLVYIPTNDRITISNKILDEKERFRLKKIANSVSKGTKGLIIRTEAVGCTKEELEADINELKERYEEIIKEYKLGIGPKLLYKELDFSSKYIKDNVNEDIEKIVTNDKCKYDELKNILKSIKKEYIEKLELEENKDCIDVIKATFPGGSITGAPKIRSMEIIDELEPTQRNVYTGSIGYIGFNGDMDLNIAIRTIVKQDDNVYFQVGGGMTWDSNPEDEYQETLDKAQSIMKALRGYYEE